MLMGCSNIAEWYQSSVIDKENCPDTGIPSYKDCIKTNDYRSSEVSFADNWGALNAKNNNSNIAQPRQISSETEVTQKQWWRYFDDATLNTLIQKGLENNKDLLTAKARVEEARAQRAASASQLAPNIQGTADASRSDQSAFSDLKPFNTVQANLQATWELDLFGSNSFRLREAEAIFQSEEARSQAVTISLLADIARNYFDYRNFERQIAIIETNLQGQRHTLKLIERLRNETMATELDLQRAAAQVSTTEALLPDIKYAWIRARNRLSVLTGNSPGSMDELLKTPDAAKLISHDVLVSAPAEVIANRPDVKAAERRFVSSIAATKAAKADLFPKISLTGFFGLQNNAFVSYTPFSLAASLVQPILDFGRLQAQIDSTDARQQQAFLGYQKAVLEALENMENALSSYLNEIDKNTSLKAASAQNKRSLELAKTQFKEGYINLLDLIVVERNLLDSEAQLSTSEAKLRNDLVSIYTAAGGGWVINTTAVP